MSKSQIDRLELLPVAEAVKFLPISKSKLYQMLKRDDCPIDRYKPGGKMYIDMISAQKWILSTKVENKTKNGSPRKR